ncbi:MAG TPA: hypothetical protein VJ346_06150, partial [Bacteroidales bacterium]|nr:hypothetical protein [Bacteroidales bacterium]
MKCDDNINLSGSEIIRGKKGINSGHLNEKNMKNTNFGIWQPNTTLKMKIIDLDERNKSLYFVCLEDWSDEMKESGNHKECWYNQMQNKGLRVKLAEDDNGTVGGMIQYLPVEYSNAAG